MFEMPRKYSNKLKEKEHYGSLMDIGVSSKIGKQSTRRDEFDVLPWDN